MKLTIIPTDSTVYVDNLSYDNLVLSNIPLNVHALQWDENKGHIEYTDYTVEQIEDLPSWASDAVSNWNNANEKSQLPPETTPVILSDEDKMLRLRFERDKRIAASDWVELPSVVALHDSTWVSAWAVYRQALRDLPNQPNLDLDNIVYPTPPQ